MSAKSWIVSAAALFMLTLALVVPVDAQEKEEPKEELKVAPKVALTVPQYLQATSVTVRAAPYSGSGSIVQTADGQVWVWTAGHVVEHLRHARDIFDDKGGKRTQIEYADAKIQQFHKNKDDGRIVSTFLADAEVIRVSGSDYGHDLALLRVRDKEFKPAASTKFYLDKDLPDIGNDLYHCGSLLGPVGSNSLTSGIMSQHGRVFDNKIYDQTTATSFPGSSGGIVCLKNDGRYVGMLVMGAGEGFGLIVPVRRMKQWAKTVGVDFALDPSVKVPTNEELYKKPIEDSGTGAGPCCRERIGDSLKFMLHDSRDPLARSLKDLQQWFARPGGLMWTPKSE